MALLTSANFCILIMNNGKKLAKVSKWFANFLMGSFEREYTYLYTYF